MLNQRVKTDRIYSNQPRNQQSISTLSEGSECSKAGNGIEKKQKRILLNNADDDMKYLLYIICIIVCVGCSPSDKRKNILISDGAEKEAVYDCIPSDAYSIAGNEEWQVFLNDETIKDSIEGLPPVKQVSLWIYEKSKKSAKKILLTHPDANGSWFTMEHSVCIPLDSIPTISKATILSWKGEPLKIITEGCSDYRNVLSFIINSNSDKAICLPTNRGLIGVSEEDGLLIMQSYAYYEEGGRFNVIEAFDKKGKRIASMDARVQ